MKAEGGLIGFNSWPQAKTLSYIARNCLGRGREEKEMKDEEEEEQMEGKGKGKRKKKKSLPFDSYHVLMMNTRITM